MNTRIKTRINGPTNREANSIHIHVRISTFIVSLFTRVRTNVNLLSDMQTNTDHPISHLSLTLRKIKVFIKSVRYRCLFSHSELVGAKQKKKGTDITRGGREIKNTIRMRRSPSCISLCSIKGDTRMLSVGRPPSVSKRQIPEGHRPSTQLEWAKDWTIPLPSSGCLSRFCPIDRGTRRKWKISDITLLAIRTTSPGLRQKLASISFYRKLILYFISSQRSPSFLASIFSFRVYFFWWRKMWHILEILRIYSLWHLSGTLM
ncbi:hypothetical protein NPIL_197301 [Nephila pilipes]|uniref:Uncharacterized protein n=1 Tax=Nephila pilipes TaxID=299642 RepID=A0A8X6PM34_NEPPI|nr:hypothetical protein NPIL_197301 [Nephila pilipes]